MPYIITTLPEFKGDRAKGAGFKQNVSRRAVATLDEAREEIWNLLDASTDTDQVEVNLPESGGTVGPLPDGTVIEVERVSGYALVQRIHPAERRPKQRTYGDSAQGSAFYIGLVIEAYNVAHEVPA